MYRVRTIDWHLHRIRNRLVYRYGNFLLHVHRVRFRYVNWNRFIDVNSYRVGYVFFHRYRIRFGNVNPYRKGYVFFDVHRIRLVHRDRNRLLYRHFYVIRYFLFYMNGVRNGYFLGDVNSFHVRRVIVTPSVRRTSATEEATTTAARATEGEMFFAAADGGATRSGSTAEYTRAGAGAGAAASVRATAEGERAAKIAVGKSVTVTVLVLVRMTRKRIAVERFRLLANRYFVLGRTEILETVTRSLMTTATSTIAQRRV